MDKSWLNVGNRADPRYIQGADNFLEWAYSKLRVGSKLRCPCKKCRNTLFKVRHEVRFDLLQNGFWQSYKVWDLHGEALVTTSNLPHGNNVEEDDITEMIHDAYGVANTEDMNTLVENNEEPNLQAKKFYQLLEDAETSLYPNCDKVSKLSFIVRLLNLKCLNHWSDKSVDMLLDLFKEVLPAGAQIPNSYYEAKKIIQDLGLDYTKIDACKNDCILYRKEYANAQSCPKCNLSRWKLNG